MTRIPAHHHRRRHHAAGRVPGPRVHPRVRGLSAGRRHRQLIGRLTLNPIVHFDPIGGTLLAHHRLGGPVRVRLGQADAGQPDATCATAAAARRSVAAAGPLSNLVMAGSRPRSRCASSLANPAISSLQLPLLVSVLASVRADQRRPDDLQPASRSRRSTARSVLFASLDRETGWRSGPSSSSTASSS